MIFSIWLSAAEEKQFALDDIPVSTEEKICSYIHWAIYKIHLPYRWALRFIITICEPAVTMQWEWSAENDPPPK